jgi:hypothetical protein
LFETVYGDYAGNGMLWPQKYPLQVELSKEVEALFPTLLRVYQDIWSTATLPVGFLEHQSISCVTPLTVPPPALFDYGTAPPTESEAVIASNGIRSWIAVSMAMILDQFMNMTITTFDLTYDPLIALVSPACAPHLLPLGHHVFASLRAEIIERFGSLNDFMKIYAKLMTEFRYFLRIDWYIFEKAFPILHSEHDTEALMMLSQCIDLNGMMGMDIKGISFMIHCDFIGSYWNDCPDRLENAEELSATVDYASKFT